MPEYLQKEIWFQMPYKDRIESGSVTRTFRELPDAHKNNDYVDGEIIRCLFHLNGNLDDEKYRIRIRKVSFREIGELLPEDFIKADASSVEGIKRKMSYHYKKSYTDSDKIRVIDFEYAGAI